MTFFVQEICPLLNSKTPTFTFAPNTDVLTTSFRWLLVAGGHCFPDSRRGYPGPCGPPRAELWGELCWDLSLPGQYQGFMENLGWAFCLLTKLLCIIFAATLCHWPASVKQWGSQVFLLFWSSVLAVWGVGGRGDRRPPTHQKQTAGVRPLAR